MTLLRSLVILALMGSVAFDSGLPEFPENVDIPVPALEVEVVPHITFIRVTAYNAVPGQTDSDPEMSSCGPTLPNQIAVSRDLFFSDGRKHLCGRTGTLYARGRVFPNVVINDTLAPRYNLAADVLMDSYAEAMEFGVAEGHFIFD